MKPIIYLLLVVFGVFFLVAWMLSALTKDEAFVRLEEGWRGYKNIFVQPDGKVYRIEEEDVTSEGQANAMLRAVIMDDQETFGRILTWTQNNLSRKDREGDYLLSWYYKNGAVQDSMPAADADIEYALALLLASRKWDDGTYAETALLVLKDILDRLTVVFRGRRYLLPWIIQDPADQERIPQNLSYYSPSFFKFFYEYDRDPRWLELVDTTYDLLLQAQKEFDGMQGCGVVPDWSKVDHQGKLHAYEGKSSNFSWEAVRVPMRVGIDAFLFRDPRAIEVLSGFVKFAETQLNETGKLVSKYSYDCKPLSTPESPLMFSSIYIAMELTNSPQASSVWERLSQWFHRSRKGGYYEDPRKYYTNSLVWVADFLYMEKAQ
ncbi:MAG: glycosyl hydrolase family 8 [Candidatus Omnitrophota bacterium]